MAHIEMMSRQLDVGVNSSSALLASLIEPLALPPSIALLPASSSSFSSVFLTWEWYWYHLLYLALLGQATSIVWKYWWKAPSNVAIAAYPTVLGRWVTALCMIFDSETLLQRAYEASDGKPFAIPMTDRWIVFVSDKHQIKRLDAEPETLLSMEEALHEVITTKLSDEFFIPWIFSDKYKLAFTAPILGGLQVPPEHKGPKSEAFRVMVGVLKNQLRSNMPAMSDAFRVRIRDAVALEVQESKGPKESNEWKRIRLMPALLRTFTRVNLLAFLGEDQADRIKVYDDVMSFFWSCASAFPILNLMPGFLLPMIGPVAMGLGFTRAKVFDLVHAMTQQSLAGKHLDNTNSQAKKHITHWTAEMTKLRDAAAVAKITLGLLFASAFQVPMIAQFCIYNLCKHPESNEQLRAEAEECKDMAFGSLNEEMPYLDSFLKETARLSPGPILSAPRTVMAPYTSSDGYHVPAHNWLAIPQLSLMRDDKLWHRASEFDAFRFVDGKTGISVSRFTHPSHEYPFWGAIRHACPARFYVSIVMKMILSHLILEYEFKLEKPEARPYLTFGKTRLPNPFMTLLVRKRPTQV